jgi:hypothetical protein
MMPTFKRKSLLATEQNSPDVSGAVPEVRTSMGRKAESSGGTNDDER